MNDPEADAADVRSVLAGNLDAFGGIVARWQRPIVNLAYRFFRDRAVAEEMAQEAFLRAFRSLKSRRQDAAFSTWLIALALNVCRSGLRRREPARQTLPEESDRSERTELPVPHDIEGAIVNRNREDLVRRAVAVLPPRYRDALVLFYFLEMNASAAARCLGIAEGTLKSRLHRGRNMLRPRLAKLAPGRPEDQHEEAAHG